MKFKAWLASLGALGAPADDDRQYWYDESGNVSKAETFSAQQARLAGQYAPLGSAGSVAVANDGVEITDANFARPDAVLVIWPMADGVTPANAQYPDIINTAEPVILTTAPTLSPLTVDSDTQITATWGTVAGATSYQYDVDGGTPVTATSPAAITGLTAETLYSVRVRAVNSSGNGPWSAAQTATTDAVAPTVPDAPTIGTATAGDTEATVTFTAPADNGGSAITGYTVTSSPGGLTGAGASSPITVTGLTNDTAYTFTVTATNAIGTSVASTASNSVTPTPPPAFTVLDTQRSYGSLTTSDVTIPASVSPGDTILVLTSGSGNQVFAPADPTGWTIVGETGSNPPIGIYRRTAGASETVYSFTRRNAAFGSVVNSDWETNALCVTASGFGSATLTAGDVVSSPGPVVTPESTAVDGDTLWHIWAVSNGTGLSFEWLAVPAPAVDLDPPVETTGSSKQMLQVATEDIIVTGATVSRSRGFQSTLPDSRTALHRGGVLVITPA